DQKQAAYSSHGRSSSEALSRKPIAGCLNYCRYSRPRASRPLAPPKSVFPCGGNGCANHIPGGYATGCDGYADPSEVTLAAPLHYNEGSVVSGRVHAQRNGFMKILVIDIGGTNVKMLASGQTEMRKMRSGSRLIPSRMVQGVIDMTDDWDYDVVTIGFPGLVGRTGPSAEPKNLGPGWVGFNFAKAFGKPVKVINDAAMQALGSYEGGRMLFLGLGTSIGSALISDMVIVPLELGQLPCRKKHDLEACLGKPGLKRLGLRPWQQA